ncbi:MAG: RnfABCDGE type electron transport complex subunit B [Candidatus Margulisiibacteriota bacterium]|nr:RnfABCDGE type electron transport complex subunit B [Candidatus Margulisiibacteriota bacterium]
MNLIIIALITMGGLGLFFATILAIASEKLKVREDPRVAEINEALPGLNCGACGQAGCHDLAEKIAAKGSLEGLSCPPGGEEVAVEIAKILGVEAGQAVRKRAVVKCGGIMEKAVVRGEYRGIKSCAAAELIAGGPKLCSYGCMGFGDCVTVCPFDAIHILEDGLPHVDEAKCTACGLCVEACPRNIIELVPSTNRIVVACSSKDKAIVSRKACKVSCIACNICVKTAPEAYTITDFLSKVNYEKGDEKAEPAMAKCPTKCIVKL